MSSASTLLACYAAVNRVASAVRRRVLIRANAARIAVPPADFDLSRSPMPEVERQLRDQGCGLIALGETGLVLTREDLAGLDEALGLAAATPQEGPWRNLDSAALLARSPAIYRLGLSPGLLDFAESYLEAPCLYLGAVLKREAPDGSLAGARGWHLDIEDRRVLRVLFYLNDVVAGGGPFEYVTAEDTSLMQRSSGYRSGYLAAEKFTRLCRHHPIASTEVLGLAGEAVVFDGARVLHRAQPPRLTSRYSLTLTYTSRRPYELRLSTRMSREQRRDVARTLDSRQRDCLPPARPL